MPDVCVAIVSSVVTPAKCYNASQPCQILCAYQLPKPTQLTQRDASRHGALVQPEGHPRDDDQHAARNVDLDQVVRELAFEQQVDLQATVFACKMDLMLSGLMR